MSQLCACQRNPPLNVRHEVEVFLTGMHVLLLSNAIALPHSCTEALWQFEPMQLAAPLRWWDLLIATGPMTGVFACMFGAEDVGDLITYVFHIYLPSTPQSHEDDPRDHSIHHCISHSW